MSEVTVPDNDELIITSLECDYGGQVNSSRWTGKRKVIGLPGGEQWYAAAFVSDISNEAEERQWRAFLSKLRGVRNWFKLVVACLTHSGSKPKIAAGGAPNYQIPLKGMTASTTILLAGQYMTVPLPSGMNRLVRLESDLVTNSAGNAIANTSPALNEIPAENAVCETVNPFLPVAQTTSRNGLAWDNAISGFQLTLEETQP